MIENNELELYFEIDKLKDKLKKIKLLAKDGYEANNMWGNKVTYKDILDSIYQICCHDWNATTHESTNELLPENYYGDK